MLKQAPERFKRLIRLSQIPLGIAVLGALVALPSVPAQAASEVGLWIDDTGKGAVEIKPCGKMLCGHIVWLREPTNSRGEPLTDGYNPDPVKRRRPICGLPVLGNLQRMTSGGWGAGWVYDPKKGKAYEASIALASSDRLTVTGYWGIFSKSFIWTRAKQDLPRCTLTEAGAGSLESSTSAGLAKRN